MFPNPQDAFPLPLRPNLERYKKLARDLIKACKSGKPDAIGDWAEAWVTMLVRRSGLQLGRKESRVIGRWTEQVEAFAQRTFSNTPCRCAVMAVWRSPRGIGTAKSRAKPTRSDVI